MKLFAYYLPQFHEIEENNKWWGKGFTEWTNVKKARPLYKGHNQPQIPLNENYYSLENIETLKWQQQLLEYYKMDGLIFYHYYFKGKKLLEKPAEMLLNNKNIDIDYFFCWANHTWKKSWEGSSEILIEQVYGRKEDWEEHFKYLLPFFKDIRYQKRKNRPILMVFKSDFKEKNDIFEYFNERCKQEGFEGICIIETRKEEINTENLNNNYMNLVHIREPDNIQVKFMRKIKNIPYRIINKIKRVLLKFNLKFVMKYNGDKFLKLMCKQYEHKENTIRGLFFEWDNTPRHSYRGCVIYPIKKKTFFRYMNLLKDEEYLFINAWNEWAEGMMLEPTEKNGYKYLEWIKEWKEKNS